MSAEPDNLDQVSFRVTNMRPAGEIVAGVVAMGLAAILTFFPAGSGWIVISVPGCLCMIFGVFFVVDGVRRRASQRNLSRQIESVLRYEDRILEDLGQVSDGGGDIVEFLTSKGFTNFRVRRYLLAKFKGRTTLSLSAFLRTRAH